VLIAAQGPSQAASVAAAWADRIDIVAGTWAPASAPSPHAAPDEVLIRPDGYVAWAAPGGGDISAALGRWFGSARAAVTARPAAAS
jgi:hypothetical protein